ncbi:MAG TPA: GH92 family glycosyl hydrolase [Pyrinomonadaceae bacterium]|nr:GH92 family glycosyl hydrolase [Pyrinomonadaceae bacterium]
MFVLFPLTTSSQQKLTRYVDPFVGTGGHGHTFPGATMPFGMVQLSPDTRLTGWDGCSGYHYSDSIIYGFSHTHLSGTGISDYGDILLMPTVGQVYLNALNGTDTSKGYASRFEHRNETAQPGYYSVRLDDENILVELTTTRRAGMHRYTYPATNAANIILDLTHRDKVTDSGLQITGPTRLVGWRRSQAWAKDQIVFFAAEFSQSFTQFGISVDDKQSPGLREARGNNIKGFFKFDASSGRPILLKVGISATGIDGALKNLAEEIKGWDFDGVRQAAAGAWESELRKIEVSGGTETQLKNFYTALYHTMTAPNLFMDVDGQYRGRDFKNHQAHGFENYTVFSLWDTFRAAHPLYTIIDQKRTLDFIKTFLTQYEQGGRLPVWELAANETDTMIGYHAVSVIADAAAKDIRGFDLQKALDAMKHSANQNHFGLQAYKDHGYLEMEEERESVSKTLEYAYDDWCIAEVARMLGQTADYRHYLRRAQSYKNVFDRTTGFMRPRSNGGWLKPFEPREVNFSFTEANSWQYTFFVPHDVSGLMELMGGRRKFAEKLDALFSAASQTTGREQADITGLIGQYAHGNEPSHHMAYLYNYAAVPWKTQYRVREILDKLYAPTPDGLTGNEDCGQMSAWYVLSAAGFYSVTPGSPIYAIGTPLFPKVTFNLENGEKFVVRANGVSSENIYIQAARLNGRPYSKTFLSHQTIMNGGELIFQMGPRPNRVWGTRANDIPVSAIVESPFVAAPVISGAGKTFRDLMKVEIELDSGSKRAANIYYSIDGSQPTAQSRKYVAPFSIEQTSTIKAITVDSSGNSSPVTTAVYHRVPHNWTLKIQSSYSSQYSGGGDSALIDGIRGTTNWSGGAWQGYQGIDLVALIDLGEQKTISNLGAGFLQDVGSWIWMPRRVEFEISPDGQKFHPVLTIENHTPDGNGSPVGVVVKDFKGDIRPQPGRYVRIRAVTFGKIPAWHPGHGGDAWIFADEIWVN